MNMNSNRNYLFLVHFLLFLSVLHPNFDSIKLCSAASHIKPTTKKCLQTEREALVAFKKDLTDPSGKLTSWTANDCCKWNGIECSTTGHIIKLDLKNLSLGGKIDPSLLVLDHLNYLDLSLNDFRGLEIPNFIGSLVNLKYLNLSSASFSGEIPYVLGNLSKLQYLDLYAESGELRAKNLSWLSSFSSLKYLNLGYVNLNGLGPGWLQAFNVLPSLVELHLFNCQLQSLPNSLPAIKFTLLSVLDLSENSFNSVIPHWLFELSSLTKLYLRWNFLTGHIPADFIKLINLEVLDLSNNLELGGQVPSALGRLPKLTFLDLSASNLDGEVHEFFNAFKTNDLVFIDLSSNSLEGSLPESLGVLKNLEYLDLSSNSFSGSIPSAIGNLTSLKKIDLSYNKMDSIPENFGQLEELMELNLMANSWEGIITESHFAKLKKLQSFRLTVEPKGILIFKISKKWVPPFRSLKLIQLENCVVGPAFPTWIQVQGQVTSVILKNVGISDIIPERWFTRISSQVTYLVLSNNQIKGKLPRKLFSPNLNTIDLSSNHFEGPFPLWSTNATDLILQDNLFSGPVPESINILMPRLERLYLSWNRFNGGVPSSLCDMSSLQIISFRSNHFSGEIPNCWRSFRLWGFDISNNTLTGKIPTSFGLLPSFSVVLLSDNNLDGEIPASLQNCSGLTSIDLGGNKLTGSLPSWIKAFSSLFMLRLRSNLFSGKFPEQLCNLPNLHILDLSGNKFAGPIPSCIGNLTAFASGRSSEVFENLLFIVTRGRDPEYSRFKASVYSIDLSGNKLTGGIPDQVYSLSILRILNLSRNLLTKSISEKIKSLQMTERLDLSHNHLSGPIPQNLAAMPLLSSLNLSYNALSGRIPTLSKFNDSSIYEGNPLLCGAPLTTKCPRGPAEQEI